MKKIKITPLLLFSPLSIVLYILYIRAGVWTSFSHAFIIGFILIVLVILLIDRSAIKQIKLRKIWVIETVFIMLSTILFLANACRTANRI